MIIAGITHHICISSMCIPFVVSLEDFYANKRKKNVIRTPIAHTICISDAFMQPCYTNKSKTSPGPDWMT